MSSQVTYAKPYLEKFSFNLQSFVGAPPVVNVPGLPTTSYGNQPREMKADIALFIGSHRGTMSFHFPDTATEGDLVSINTVLPAGGQVETAFSDLLIDEAEAMVPELHFDPEDAGASASGVKMWTRLIRVECNIPWGKPQEWYILATVGAFADEACTQQLNEFSLTLAYVTDEFILRFLPAAFDVSLTEEQKEAALTEYRQTHKLIDMMSLLATPQVGATVGAMVQSIFTAAKASSLNWADLSIEAAMVDFATTFQGIVGGE